MQHDSGVRLRTLFGACSFLVLLPTGASAAEEAEPPVDQKAIKAPEDLGTEPAETDFPTPGRTIKEPAWTEYDLKFFTLRWGIYTLVDFGNAYQSEASEAQIDVVRAIKLRDFRLSFSGKLATQRSITYTTGVMYDATQTTWFARETGIQVAFPELWGAVFVGRQKEGISLSKITNGYAGWTMERAAATDIIPILADGVKWLGGLPSHRANWNFAFYDNEIAANPATGWYDNEFVGRVAVLPVRNDDTGTLLHLGLAYQWGKYSNGQVQFDSKPESNTAPTFIDTGVFAADHDNMYGLEVYYRNGSWFAGGEYLLDDVRAPDVGNPLMQGGNVFVTYLLTGEQRPYIDLGGKVGFVKPERSAFTGGPGAWEAVMAFSYTDYDDDQVSGGKMWRATPQINWYLDDMLSLRANYGLVWLDRFDTPELSHLFQARVEYKIQ
jgi:phosphate-selective porin OprO/OprP